jgi:hypothetical protein
MKEKWEPISAMDGPDYEVVAIPAAEIAGRLDAVCGAFGCKAKATHVYRSLAKNIGAWLCDAHAERIRKIRGTR